ncbi:16S rRNA pseudouridine(516) synthase [Gemmobacter sp.]|uniref:pseudouridine synthase n=1 Tax=Gemmobacter sp. TaxID=1898957 RepID=UPI002AFF6304|nr:16S rRNA pseudouridine(516) synthase [Gemmobacter sp.]
MTKAVNARLDKLLSSMGYGSRREIGGLARADRIVLNGENVNDVTRRIRVTADLPTRITVDGIPLDPVAGLVILLNKPAGVTCSHNEAGPLVYDLLPTRWRRRDPALSTVGRLDKETSGLLLLTDDGELLHRITSPKRKVSKTYRATLSRPLNGDEVALFASGTLVLKGETKPLDPAILEVMSPTEAHLTITEGRYHQVRRMFAACGNHVEALRRERLGQFHLPEELAVGSWRLLGGEEQQLIFR